jgi:hypothetical protein
MKKPNLGHDKLPYWLWIILTAPVEVIGVTAICAGRGFRMGCENVRDAWRERNAR